MSQTLHDQITFLRLAAAKIYDDGIAAGMKPEKVQEDIFPLQEGLAKAVYHSAHHNIPDCILAVDRFEADANALEQQATRLLKKSAEVTHYAESIKAELVARMEAEGKTHLKHGEFTVTLVVQPDGTKTASLR